MPFCRFCGRELRDGEVCSCRSGSASGRGSRDNYFRSSGTDSADGWETGSADASGWGSGSMGKDDGEYIHIDPEKLKRAKDKAFDMGARGASKAAEWAHDASEKSRSGDAYERGVPIVGGPLMAAKGEIPVKQYNINILRSMFSLRMEGRLQVTTKRLIYRAKGKSWYGPLFQEWEYAIKDILGVEVVNGRLLNRWFALFGLLMICAATFLGAGAMSASKLFGGLLGALALAGGIVLALTAKKYDWAKLMLFAFATPGLIGLATPGVLMIIGIPAMLVSFAGEVIFYIRYIHVEDFIVLIKTVTGGNAIKIGKFGIRAPESLPWLDTEQAVRELGAMVLDIRDYGEEAVERWR